MTIRDQLLKRCDGFENGIEKKALSIKSIPMKFSKILTKIILYLILLDLAYVFFYPFAYMLVTSLKTNADLYDPTVNWVPRVFKWENYVLAFKSISYLNGLKNTLIYTVFGTIGHLFSCSLAGYTLARYNFKGRGFIFALMLLSIVIPTQAIVVPLYLTYSNLGWLNTYFPVTIPTFFGFGLRGGLFIFVFRQFFSGLPRELEDAAKVDGCNYISAFYRIIAPSSKASFLVVGILSMVWHWNDYYEPEFYAFLEPMRTLANSLQNMVPYLESPGLRDQLMSAAGITDPELFFNNATFMAGTVLTILPIVIVFMFLQKQFMQGIERTGLVE